jgi:lipopolysaccharide export LptBFGC system permease protein LptF
MRVFRALAVGYAAVLTAIALSTLLPSALTSVDRRAIRRTLYWAVGTIVGVSALLMIPPAVGFSEFVTAGDMVLIVPQALPLAIPIGVALGIAFGFGGLPISRNALSIVLSGAILLSMISFGTIGWLMPAANQQFRQSAFHATGNRGTLMKGANEMTFAELRREIRNSTESSDPSREHFEWAYHLRWALPFATIALAIFALALQGSPTSVPRAGVMVAAPVYLVLLFSGEMLVGHAAVPAVVGAWLANGVLVIGAIIVIVWRAGRAESPALPR